jgi:hypothetical protein
MMDIVDRLRFIRVDDPERELCHEAAQQIERLRSYISGSVARETLMATEAELDEAREAARWLYANATDQAYMEFKGDAILERWPWLE